MAIRPEDAVRAIAAARGDAICVLTMTQIPAWRTLAPDAPSIACVGFMGGASALGLGLALGCPGRRVIVLDGDGSLLMQLGSLATIGSARPRNLVHVLFKNGVYHTSGSQPVPAALEVEFATIARATGYPRCHTFADLAPFERALPGIIAGNGPVFVELETSLAAETPLTAGVGPPFHQQVETLRARLASP